jgi:hypothetical protein
MMRTQAYHRVWCDIYADPRKRHNRGAGFTQIVQSPAGGHSTWQNMTMHQVRSMANRNAFYGGSTERTRVKNGRIQRRVANKGGGSYSGPGHGRRLPG